MIARGRLAFEYIDGRVVLARFYYSGGDQLWFSFFGTMPIRLAK
jgi:hypothetical protein